MPVGHTLQVSILLTRPLCIKRAASRSHHFSRCCRHNEHDGRDRRNWQTFPLTHRFRNHPKVRPRRT